MYYIISNVYLSNLRDAENISLIRHNNIEVVCRLSEDHNDSIYGSNIVFRNFEVEDNILGVNDMLTAAKAIATLIDNTNLNVLVHCNEGQSRSVSVIIYYMMTRYGYSFDAALARIKSIKGDARPNSAFERALRAIQNSTI